MFPSADKFINLFLKFFHDSLEKNKLVTKRFSFRHLMLNAEKNLFSKFAGFAKAEIENKRKGRFYDGWQDLVCQK